MIFLHMLLQFRLLEYFLIKRGGRVLGVEAGRVWGVEGKKEEK